MKVLITGASGLLGAHLVEQGLELGFDLTCVGRTMPAKSYLRTVQDKIKFITLDLSKPLEKNILEKDFDVIIHAAALASPFAQDEEKMQALNVEGTKNLYSYFQGQAKWVQISSVATMSNGEEGVVDESFFGKCRQTYYAKTKVESDLWLEAQNNTGILFIHPCYMLGKYDSRPSSGAIFLGLKLKRFSHYISGNKNFVAASDVATGIYQGLEKNMSGHFLLGHVNTSVENFLQISANKMKIDNFPEKISKENLLESSDLSNEKKAFVAEFCLSNEVNWDKAASQFGYSPKVGLEAMIEESLDYFCEKKMLRIRS